MLNLKNLILESPSGTTPDATYLGSSLQELNSETEICMQEIARDILVNTYEKMREVFLGRKRNQIVRRS